MSGADMSRGEVKISIALKSAKMQTPACGISDFPRKEDLKTSHPLSFVASSQLLPLCSQQSWDK